MLAGSQHLDEIHGTTGETVIFGLHHLSAAARCGAGWQQIEVR
jgi:hypothetical protein